MLETLDPGRRSELLQAARDAAAHAYCPFSKFRVGASALTAEGKIFSGCNVENDSFGLTVCAERVAIWKAISSGSRRIVAMAISLPDAPAEGPQGARMPCGACRQVMAQFATGDMQIVIDQLGDLSLGEMLPDPFRL